LTEFKLLTQEEAAEFLRMSPSSIHRLRMDGKIPFVKMCKRVLFSQEALIRFAEDQQFQYEEKSGD
jgi:excisionase family DNA binding protein